MPSLYDLPQEMLEWLGPQKTAIIQLLEDPDKEVFGHVHAEISGNIVAYEKVLTMILDYAEVRSEELLIDRVKILLRGQRLSAIMKELKKENLDLINFYNIILMIDEMIMMKSIGKDHVLHAISMFQKELWLQMDMEAAPEMLLDELTDFFFHRMQFRGFSETDSGDSQTFLRSITEAKANDFLLFMIFKTYTDFFSLDLVPIRVNDIYLLGLKARQSSDLIRVVEFPSGEIYTRELLPKYFHQDELKAGILQPRTKGHAELVLMYIEHILDSDPEDQTLVYYLAKLRTFVDDYFQIPPF